MLQWIKQNRNKVINARKILLNLLCKCWKKIDCLLHGKCLMTNIIYQEIALHSFRCIEKWYNFLIVKVKGQNELIC